jgi:hypothetical protein
MGIAAPLPDDVLSGAEVGTVKHGTALQEGETYIDLDDLATGPFRARGRIVAHDHDRLVPRRDTEPETWRRLVELAEQAER